jgi:hypothetical protein
MAFIAWKLTNSSRVRPYFKIVGSRISLAEGSGPDTPLQSEPCSLSPHALHGRAHDCRSAVYFSSLQHQVYKLCYSLSESPTYSSLW